MTTLMISALLITFLNSGVGSTDADKMHGAFSLSGSAEPLLDGFRVIYGTGTAKLLAFLAVIDLIANFHTIIYAYGRQICSLSRAGYYLPFMSVTHGTHKVLHTALYAGTVLGFGIMLAVWFLRGAEAGGALIYVLEWNRAAIEAKMVRLAAWLGLADRSFSGVLAWVLELRHAIGIPHTLADIGVREEHARAFAPQALNDPSTGGNRLPMTEQDFEQLHRICIAGRRPG